MCTVAVSMPGSGSVSRRMPLGSRYSVTPSSETTLRGASAATAQAAHSSKLPASSRFIRLGALFLLLATLLRFLGARLALGRIFRLRAHLLAHAVAMRVALLAFAGLFGLAARCLELRDAFLATRGILRLRAVDGLSENAGTGREEKHADQGFEHE